MTYLAHPGSGLDVLCIDLSHFPDTFASAITSYNEQQSRVTLTDGRQARIGIRRIERTEHGAMLVRPRSAQVQRVYNALGAAFKKAYDWEMIDKCYPSWCLLPGEDCEEVWEFEWSYWAYGKDAAYERPERRKIKYREYWAVLATGMIAIRDQYDIPRAEMEARCAKAVAMGVVWCILMDQEHNDLIVYRPNDEPERRTDIEGWTLPEMPDVPYRQEWIQPKRSA